MMLHGKEAISMACGKKGSSKKSTKKSGKTKKSCRK